MLQWRLSTARRIGLTYRKLRLPIHHGIRRERYLSLVTKRPPSSANSGAAGSISAPMSGA